MTPKPINSLKVLAEGMTGKPSTCLARQGPDRQLRCARCGLVWDIDDPEPPTCRDEPVPKPKVKKPSKRKPKQ